MSPHRTTWSLAAVAGIALTLGACAGDPIPPSGTPTGPAGPTEVPSDPCPAWPECDTMPAPPVDLPTTDDGLGLPDRAFDTVDRALRDADDQSPTLSIADIATLEELSLGETGQRIAWVVEHSTIAGTEDHGTTDGTEGRFDQDVWQVYTADADEVSIVSWPAPLDPDPHAWEPLEVETFGNEELDTGAEDQLAAHEVGLTDTAAAAVTARPGSVLIVATTDDVSARSLLAVGILQDDGTALRVTVDAATGEVLNAVPVGNGASDGGSRGDRGETEEPDEGGTTT
ncbi:hypothetical protein [Georgenia sp. Z1491]|uniref:hypothetical protein n=1 Tax=Georgenia sp. Z1491 TaxID=3416707 RepID=UPI003CF2C8C1